MIGFLIFTLLVNVVLLGVVLWVFRSALPRLFKWPAFRSRPRGFSRETERYLNQLRQEQQRKEDRLPEEQA